MSRIFVSLALGGAMLILAAACGSQATSESLPESIEHQEAAGSDTGNTEIQSPETSDKPLVTVNLSPT